MSTELLKLELINWISHVKDKSILEGMLKLKNSTKLKNNNNPSKRNFSDGKHIFTYISDDFNEPLDDFKEYMG